MEQANREGVAKSMKKVFLYGILEDKFGRGPYEFEAATTDLVLNGIALKFEGFKEALREGKWTVVVGKRDEDKFTTLNEQGVRLLLAEADEIHVFPAIEGQFMIAGAALLLGGVAGGMALGFGTALFSVMGMSLTWGTIAGWGLSMVLTGVAGMLGPSANVSDAMSGERPEERPSFMFNGPVNVSEQGGAVPIVYGEFQVGSTVISAGIDVEAI